MKSAYKILYSVLLLSCTCWFSYAKEYLSFETFVQDIEEQAVNNQNLTYTEAENLFDEVRDHECYIQYFDTQSYVSPMCFYDEGDMNMSVDLALNYLLSNLDYFMDSYKQDSYNFYYNPTQPYYFDDLLNKYIAYDESMYEKVVVKDRELSDKMVVIQNDLLAKIIYKQYSFYVVPTYLANRWPCSLQNYRIAVEKLDGFVLGPWEELTLNNLIKNNPKACKWSSSQNFLFYGWSCGSSTQLFRLALIMPYLTVLERYNHSKWWSLYYWKNLMWDDAAMYQNSERFTVRNDFDVPIYMRVYEQWDYSYLVGILPKKIDEYIEIFKETNWLNSSVTKWIFDWDWDIIDFKQFNSHYLGISNSRV